MVVYFMNVHALTHSPTPHTVLVISNPLTIKVQRNVIKEFCARHPQLKNGSPYKWPSKHLFYNDEFKLIYCYVPKGMLCVHVRIIIL